MPDEKPAQKSRNVVTTVLTDVHFWIPVVVLFAGLAVLHWIR